VHLQTAGTQKRFSAKIEILLYRIIQEALTNVAKHAQAESAILSLEKKDVHVHLYITDDGKGFEVKRYFSSPPMIRRGLGILGMKERVELAGGTFFIDSGPGEGTRISIKVPIVKRGS
jgi:signal transduction histidine kinase